MSLFAYGQYKNIILDWKTKKKKKKKLLKMHQRLQHKLHNGSQKSFFFFKDKGKKLYIIIFK